MNEHAIPHNFHYLTKAELDEIFSDSTPPNTPPPVTIRVQEGAVDMTMTLSHDCAKELVKGVITHLSMDELLDILGDEIKDRK
jgi:hypothetical protein